MRGCTELLVRCIDLHPCSPSVEHTKIADKLIMYAIEGPRNAGIVSSTGASIAAALVEALADKTDTHQTLGRTTVSSPQAAVLSCEAEVILARL